MASVSQRINNIFYDMFIVFEPGRFRPNDFALRIFDNDEVR